MQQLIMIHNIFELTFFKAITSNYDSQYLIIKASNRFDYSIGL